MSEPYPSPNVEPGTFNGSLSRAHRSHSMLLSAWERLDEHLISLHQGYAHKSASFVPSPHLINQRHVQTIHATAAYSAILTPPRTEVDVQSLSVPVDRTLSLSHHDSVEEVPSKSTVTQSYAAQHLPSSETAASQRSIWSREGFTPRAQIIEPEDTSALVSNQNRAHQERGIHRGEPAIQSQPSEISARLDDLAQNRSNMMSDELIDASASDAELEAFTSVAERLMQAQEKATERATEQVYEAPDSTQPAPLEEIYESMNHIVPSVVNRPLSLHETSRGERHVKSQSLMTSMRVGQAPQPLSARSKAPWGKLILVSLISLIAGGVVAHFFLRDLMHWLRLP